MGIINRLITKQAEEAQPSKEQIQNERLRTAEKVIEKDFSLVATPIEARDLDELTLLCYRVTTADNEGGLHSSVSDSSGIQRNIFYTGEQVDRQIGTAIDNI